MAGRSDEAVVYGEHRDSSILAAQRKDAAQTRRRREVLSSPNNPPIALIAYIGSAECDDDAFQLPIDRLHLLAQTIRQWTVLVIDKAAVAVAEPNYLVAGSVLRLRGLQEPAKARSSAETGLAIAGTRTRAFFFKKAGGYPVAYGE
jgi:hypothetical protein